DTELVVHRPVLIDTDAFEREDDSVGHVISLVVGEPYPDRWPRARCADARRPFRGESVTPPRHDGRVLDALTAVVDELVDADLSSGADVLALQRQLARLEAIAA